MNKTTRLVLQQPDTLGVVEVRHAGNEARYALLRVLRHVRLERLALDEVHEALVGEVDAELVERVGARAHVLGCGSRYRAL